MSVYGDLRPEIERLIGNRTDADSRALVLANFNHVMRLLSRMHQWQELQAVSTQNLVVGKRDYTHADLGLARFSKFYTLFLTVAGSQGRPLDYITPMMWDTDVAPQLVTVSNAKPHLFTYWGQTFSLFRPPDQTYPLVVRYFQYPPPVTGDVSIVVYENVDDILVFATAGFCWLGLEERELAATWLGRAAELLQVLNIEMKSVFDISTGPKERVSRVKGVTDPWRNPFVKEVR